MDAQAIFHLVSSLEDQTTKSTRRQSSVLFRRGEKAVGVFLVLSGKVELNLGVENGYSRCYGYGALLGLPETLTKRDYAMTATVVQDAEVGFIASTDLQSMLRRSPGLCAQLLSLLSQRAGKVQSESEMLNGRVAPESNTGPDGACPSVLPTLH